MHAFEVPLDQMLDDIDSYVDDVLLALESEFLLMPKGEGFIEYPVFERGYEAVKRATGGFAHFDPAAVLAALCEVPISLVVLRTLLGFTPPEWAHVTRLRTAIDVTQGHVRALDRDVRLNPSKRLVVTGRRRERLEALVRTACDLLVKGAPPVGEGVLHRLAKADTSDGRAGMQNFAAMGVPYAVLLYERFLGRPFAGHRDSVSELVGNVVEHAVERALEDAGVSYRRTKRAERIPGFDQAPDFIVPSELSPQVVIEAKSCEDDGTARDKVTRVQHLAGMDAGGAGQNVSPFQVVACISGRGFAVRRMDMRKLLIATGGKVFTLKTIDRMVDCTRLSEFRTR